MLSPYGMNGQHQLQWLRQLLAPEWVERIELALRDESSPRTVILYRRALWFVLQLVLLSSDQSIEAADNIDVATRICRACFMASDVLTDLENANEAALPTDLASKMVCLLVPLQGVEQVRVDFDAIGRATLRWLEVTGSTEFTNALAGRKTEGFEPKFLSEYGISLAEFIRFLIAIYVRFHGNQLDSPTTPFLLDLRHDDVAKAFDVGFISIAIKLISQSPDELAISLLGPRQSWAYDISPLRERPLLEMSDFKFCCPDLTVYTRAIVDRVYFLLQQAYGKKAFRELFGLHFEAYVHRLIEDFSGGAGGGRTYIKNPRFASNKNQQAADGIFYWVNSAVVMEYKGGLLTPRQLYSGQHTELLEGINALMAKGGEKSGPKGIGQLAKNLRRLISDESKVRSSNDEFDLGRCAKVFPAIVCFEETLGFHAVRRYLQERLNSELGELASSPRIGPLFLLSAKDVEDLSTAGKSISVEELFLEYARYLTNEPNDFLGSFSNYLTHRFGTKIKWHESLTFRQHGEQLNELMKRFK